MADYKDVFETAENQNWAKLAFACHIARQGLFNFVKQHIVQLRNDLIEKNSRTCSTCKTSDVVPCPSKGTCSYGRRKCRFHTSPPIKCPNGVCNNILGDIQKEHRFNKPTWKNTDATKWCTDAWEIAKCFLPCDYRQVEKEDEIDFNGILSVVLNCNIFYKVLPGLTDHQSPFHQVQFNIFVFFYLPTTIMLSFIFILLKT